MKPFLFLALSGISFFSFISFTHATAPVEIASQENGGTTVLLYFRTLS